MKTSGRKDGWSDDWVEDFRKMKDDFRAGNGKKSGKKNSGQQYGYGSSTDRYGNKKPKNKSTKPQVLSIDKKNKKRK